MNQENNLIVVCGLDCKDCDILRATNNPEIAKKISHWVKEKRNEEVKIEDIHCFGCRGGRKMHWSPDCWILECCADKKKLEFCYKCEDFPCDKLTEWSKENKDYTEALNHLKKM